jgi:hypothetical protein
MTIPPAAKQRQLAQVTHFHISRYDPANFCLCQNSRLNKESPDLADLTSANGFVWLNEMLFEVQPPGIVEK